ncbi:hypothetical protein PCC6912_51010 [Chlorogloeopsis fritschii PCC 6912]|uniref:Uncharacterized protein n=1 Tax=Chlorogloeopsis fritschii PCC 6912 TaxID=211165 RepID=A0A433N1N4_CHLFR|nr:hypothetical protein [Chlorogloeopsis fritschii]RUR74923.1 hypothetical protein PCC6912_51010 [Chlorogloeopsis fritschii PCC 6912]
MVSQQEYDAVRRNLDRTRALKNECQRELAIWKRLAVSGISITEEYGDRLIKKINQYAGSTDFDDLSLPAQLMCAIAWSNYPSDAFTDLVDEIEKFSPDLAKIISDCGVNFRVLGKGDKCKASGWEIPHVLYIDTEEWYEDIPKSDRLWDEDDDLREQIDDAINQYANDLVDEIKDALQEDFDLSLQELYQLLR